MFFKNKDFQTQFKRTLGYAVHHGASIGECFETASLIKNGDFESWYTKWTVLADRVSRIGQKAFEKGHLVSAYQSYLRASNYYRNSYFFLRAEFQDPRIQTALWRSKDSFAKAMQVSCYSFEQIKIQFDTNLYLPGYFIRPDAKETKRPTVIFIGGYDSTAEEAYLAGAKAALERGYNCLIFEGPGQGSVLYEQKVFMRPDWECVIEPIINYVLNSSFANNTIVLLGRSLGGYLASRAAINKNVSALIVDPGLFDLGKKLDDLLPKVIKKIYQNKWKLFLNLFYKVITKLSKKREFFFKSRMNVHGINNIFDYFNTLNQFKINDIIDQIKCPTLICSNEEDPIIGSQAQDLYNSLTSSKKFILFKKSEGAAGHCEPLAHELFEQKIFDWLDEILNKSNM